MRTICLACLTAAAVGGPVRADVVTDWNETLLATIRTTSTNPPRASRNMALMNVAIFDSVNSIVGGYAEYRLTIVPPVRTSAEAAVVGAAHRILINLYPDQAATLNAKRAESLATIPDGAAEASGLALGEYVADRLLEARQNDGADTVVPYTPGSGAGEWQPTPPAFAPALLPNWPFQTCWCMYVGSQFRGNGPPDLTSAKYAAHFNEVKSLGSNTSMTRTEDQTQIAHFWADGGGTETPPGHWIAIAIDLAKARGNSLLQNARLFALLSMGLADAAICAWDNKYAYDDWRPYTGIRNADLDGNPLTEADPDWEPLIDTPPFPSYTSGHSTFSSTGARILALFFGTDEISFTADSDGLPGVTRSYTRLSDAAKEAGKGRIYGGIHWEYDNADALAAGTQLAEFVHANFLLPVTPSDVLSVPLPSLCGWLNISLAVSMGASMFGLRMIVTRRR